LKAFDLEEIKTLKNNKKLKTILVTNAKKYVNDILKTCDNYDKEIKDLDK